MMRPRAPVPLLIIALSRPELLDRRPDWGGGQRNFEFSLFFNSDSGTPSELRITMPTQLQELRVPFEFKDLPLPH